MNKNEVIINSWNVIFIGINIISENEQDNLTVDAGIEIFVKDVEDISYSERLKISFLHFVNPTPKGENIAKVYKTRQGLNNKHNFILEETYDFFDCQEELSYSRFFKQVKRENREGFNEKYLLIFLAHSFGAGFFYYDEKYFTTINLSNAIKVGFENVPIDCLMALNCQIQSVESNLIFKDTVELLIGSQIPLYVKSIFYKELLNDLTFYSNWQSEIIFSKFIYNSFSSYTALFKTGEEYFFSLTLSRPKESIILLFLFNALASKFDLENKSKKDLNERDIDFLGNAQAFCYDPSYSDKINIIDASEFFMKLKEFHTKDVEVQIIIKLILEILNKIVLLFLASPNTFKFNKVSKPKKMFLGNGLGLFIPKVDSLNLEVVYTIYSALYKSADCDLLKISDHEWDELIRKLIKNLNVIDIYLKYYNIGIPISNELNSEIQMQMGKILK